LQILSYCLIIGHEDFHTFPSPQFTVIHHATETVSLC
jgi:hypothetical protein